MSALSRPLPRLQSVSPTTRAHPYLRLPSRRSALVPRCLHRGIRSLRPRCQSPYERRQRACRRTSHHPKGALAAPLSTIWARLRRTTRPSRRAGVTAATLASRTPTDRRPSRVATGQPHNPQLLRSRRVASRSTTSASAGYPIGWIPTATPRGFPPRDTGCSEEVLRKRTCVAHARQRSRDTTRLVEMIVGSPTTSNVCRQRAFDHQETSLALGLQSSSREHLELAALHAVRCGVADPFGGVDKKVARSSGRNRPASAPPVVPDDVAIADGEHGHPQAPSKSLDGDLLGRLLQPGGCP